MRNGDWINPCADQLRSAAPEERRPREAETLDQLAALKQYTATAFRTYQGGDIDEATLFRNKFEWAVPGLGNCIIGENGGLIALRDVASALLEQLFEDGHLPENVKVYSTSPAAAPSTPAAVPRRSRRASSSRRSRRSAGAGSSSSRAAPRPRPRSEGARATRGAASRCGAGARRVRVGHSVALCRGEGRLWGRLGGQVVTRQAQSCCLMC